LKILFEFEKPGLLFQNPQKIISCHDPAKIPTCFEEMEEALRAGLYAAGFLSYEAGYAFEKKLAAGRAEEFPLLHFGCYEAPEFLHGRSSGEKLGAPVTGLRLNVTKGQYDGNIEAIRRYIAEGDVYQITYCLKVKFDFSGEPFSLYRKLFRRQPVPYAAYLETGGTTILSLSPEMFIRKKGKRVVTKPMKGTWPRGNGLFSGLLDRFKLKGDEKNRAENVMIADLLRNDLGRVGNNIRAPRLFEVTSYNTLFQMTSTVTGETDADVRLYDLFRALFPSGSVTGAPKIRAMEIIREIEGEKRRIYTGAIGYIAPNKDMFFNIPIRTLLLDKGRGEMGIGGGIVWDSTPDGEWEEGLLKAKFFTDLAADRGVERG
jgi:para-aminobenzoate synthetase/4-amino-4-deoxychorismate lyase